MAGRPIHATPEVKVAAKKQAHVAAKAKADAKDASDKAHASAHKAAAATIKAHSIKIKADIQRNEFFEYIKKELDVILN